MQRYDDVISEYASELLIVISIYPWFEIANANCMQCDVMNYTRAHTRDPLASDTQPPVIAQAANLCGTSISIANLASPGFALPTATDNTGATDVNGLTMNFDAQNNDPSIALLASKTFTYSVTDFVGLQDTCVITVDVVSK